MQNKLFPRTSQRQLYGVGKCSCRWPTNITYFARREVYVIKGGYSHAIDS